MKTTQGYIRKRGKVYYAYWQHDGRRYCRSTGAATEREAKKAFADLLAPFKARTTAETIQNLAARADTAAAEVARFEAEENPALPLEKGWIRFAAAPNRPDSGEATLRQYECQFRAFATWAAERKPPLRTFADVTKAITHEYAAHLAKRGLSGNSFNKHIRLLQLVFRVLAEPGRVPVNPWAQIGRKRAITSSRRELTIQELKAVCEAAQGEIRLLLGIGIYTGLRLGDCATLRWAETDLERRIIRRIPNKSGRRNPKPVLVPIHPVLADMLTEAAESGPGEFVLPQCAEQYQTDDAALSRVIQRLFVACGIRTTKPGTGDGTGKRASVEVGFHSLRHTFVSLCRESDVPLSVVESIVGHSNPAMTRHYSHTGAEAAARAVNGLPHFMDGEPRALPAPQGDSWREKVLALADGLSVDNIEETRREMYELGKGIS